MKKAKKNSGDQKLKDKTTQRNISYQSLNADNIIINENERALSLFFSIARLMQQDFDVNAALQSYIDAVLQLCEWQVGHIYFVKEFDDEVKLVPSTIWALREKEKFTEFQEMTMRSIYNIGEGVPGIVLENKSSCWIEDIFEVTLFLRASSGFNIGLHGAFGVPIYRYGEIIAIAEFFSRESQEKDENLLSIIEIAGIQLSTLLERRLVQEKLEENYKKLETTHYKLLVTQNELIEHSKLASIGQLAAGIAHEINNPLSFVSSNIKLLKKYISIVNKVIEHINVLNIKRRKNELPAIQKSFDDLSRIIEDENFKVLAANSSAILSDSSEGVYRITEIVKGLRTFARVDKDEKHMVNINDCIKIAIKMVWSELKYKCELIEELNELPSIYCNSLSMIQVFTNLLMNASQAITGKGKISVRSFQHENNIKIEITDTGCGISEDIISQIFDPFFTTKPIGVGTGLGLSISYGIVQNHGGSISVKSTIDKGATFTVSLPMA